MRDLESLDLPIGRILKVMVEETSWGWIDEEVEVKMLLMFGEEATREMC